VGWGARQQEIGPELMFGTIMGERYEEHVLLIKVPWGGKDVYCEFRSPSAGEGITDNDSHNLTAMFRDLRKELGAPNMPIVIGEMGLGGRVFEKQVKDKKNLEAHAIMAFRQAQKAVAEASSINAVTFVPTAEYWDDRLETLRRAADPYSRIKRDKGIADTEHNALLTKAESTEFRRLGGHWYCHYNGSAANYCLMGYALAEALPSPSTTSTR
jgi:hypothetical protein